MDLVDQEDSERPMTPNCLYFVLRSMPHRASQEVLEQIQRHRLWCVFSIVAYSCKRALCPYPL